MKRLKLKKHENSILLNHLPGILSISREKSKELIEGSPGEAAAIANMLIEVSREYGREWSAFTLAKIPLEFCCKQSNGLITLQDDLRGAMHFMMKKSYSKDLDDLLVKQLNARMFMFASLECAFEGVAPGEGRMHFEEMLKWNEGVKGAWGDRGLNFDVELFHALSKMEEYLERVVSLQELLHRRNGIDSNSVISNYEMGCLYYSAFLWVINYLDAGLFHARIEFDEMGAMADYKKLMQKWDGIKNCQDSLIVRVAANLSANRAILENQFFIGVHKISSNMNISFLTKMKCFGLVEVPGEFDELFGKVDAPNDLIGLWLIRNFGLNGVALSFLGSEGRFMTGGEIDVVVVWSSYLQRQYIENRGHKVGLAHSMASHGLLANRFIFVLVIVAAFFEKTKVPREFSGQKNSLCSVFPAPGVFPEKPNPAAEELLHVAYGQVYYGNVGWGLLADGIFEYSELAIFKRVVFQNIILRSVKGIEAPNILRNFIAMEHLRDSDNSWVDIEGKIGK